MSFARFNLALLAVLAAACTSDPAAPGGGHSSRTLLTDDPFPFDRVARVDLYVVSVSASLNPDTGSANGFITLATPKRRIDLLALQGGITDELGTVTLPSGAITAVRLVIDTDSSTITLKNGAVLTSTSTPGIYWQSGAGRPVLNALIQEQIAVPDTGAVVVIDYDVGKAFIPPQVIDPSSTDSGFIFSPVLRAADAARTGSLAGTVRAQNARRRSGGERFAPAVHRRPGHPGEHLARARDGQDRRQRRVPLCLRDQEFVLGGPAGIRQRFLHHRGRSTHRLRPRPHARARPRGDRRGRNAGRDGGAAVSRPSASQPRN